MLLMMDLTQTRDLVDFILGLVFIAFIVYLCIRLKFKLFTKAVVFISCAGLFTATFFQLYIAQVFLFFLTFSIMFVCIFSHLGGIRTYFSKYTKEKELKKNNRPNKIIDREALYDEIYETVKGCSSQKIGALITLERHDELKSLMKNGTIINAPVSHELLMTIFYPGTRLHDGAVIIKSNMIIAASVYYTPTTKALSGKYGSRHRAAIGISEMSDAITVVVSEETGRISITKGGEIIPVSLDKFTDTLSDYMSEGEN